MGSHGPLPCYGCGDVLDPIETLDAGVVDVQLDMELLLDELYESERGERIQNAACLKRCVVFEVVWRLARQVGRQNELPNCFLDVVHQDATLPYISAALPLRYRVVNPGTRPSPVEI
jgi:hypothetical protein